MLMSSHKVKIGLIIVVLQMSKRAQKLWVICLKFTQLEAGLESKSIFKEISLLKKETKPVL